MNSIVEKIKELTVDFEMFISLLEDTEISEIYEREYFENKDRKVYVAYGDGKDIGYVVYATSYAYPKMYELLYVYVDENYRNQNVATDLIRRSGEMLKTLGLGKPMVIIEANDRYMEGIFERAGYELHLVNNLMVYRLGDMLESVLYDRIDELKIVTDNAKKLSEAKATSNNQVELFKRTLEKRGVQVELEELAEEYSRYFFEKGKLVGYMAFTRYDEKMLYMNHLYISPDATNKFIIPGMILSSLRSCEDSLDKDTSIIIQFSDKNNFDAVEKSFGIADEYEENHLWIKNN